LKPPSEALAAASTPGEPDSLAAGLLFRKGTLAPKRFQLALMVEAAAENCTEYTCIA
jgi:hypothetical protein